ncbi:hypothetical protein JHK87_018803 [Glycine soja]|nr:hypothetical protein JHK87_018803 [Glycine soja]
METTKSTQQALQSVEIQVGELAEAVTQFMSRREKSFVEAEAQEKSPVKEHESREKDKEKNEEQAQQQWEKYSTVENQQENILQINDLPHQMIVKKGRQGEHEEIGYRGVFCLGESASTWDADSLRELSKSYKASIKQLQKDLYESKREVTRVESNMVEALVAKNDEIKALVSSMDAVKSQAAMLEGNLASL